MMIRRPRPTLRAAATRPSAARQGHRLQLLPALALGLLLGALACAAPLPPGPPFTPAPAPGADKARLYIFRVDSVPSGSAGASLQLAGEPLGNLANYEYLTLTVKPGKHVLSTRFLSLLSGTTSEVAITASPGVTHYIHLFAESQETQRAQGFGREVYSVGLFAAIRPVRVALPLLEKCTLQPERAVPTADAD